MGWLYPNQTQQQGGGNQRGGAQALGNGWLAQTEAKRAAGPTPSKGVAQIITLSGKDSIKADQAKLSPQQLQMIKSGQDVYNPYRDLTASALSGRQQATLTQGKAPVSSIWDKVTGFFQQVGQKVGLNKKPSEYDRDDDVVRAINAGAVLKNDGRKIVQHRIEQIASQNKTTFAVAQTIVEKQAEDRGVSVYDVLEITPTKLAAPNRVSPFRESLMQEVTKELGIRTTPSNKELFEGLMIAGLGFGLVTAPVATVASLGLLEGWKALSSGFVSAVKGKGFDISSGYTLGDLAEENKTMQNLLDTVDFIAAGAFIHQGFKFSNKIKTRITGDVIKKYNFPEVVRISPEQIARDVTKNDVKIERDLVTRLGIDKQEWKTAKSQGNVIEVPSARLIEASQQPYWGSLKETLLKTEVKPFAEPQVETAPRKAAAIPPTERIVDLTTATQPIGKEIAPVTEVVPKGKGVLASYEAKATTQTPVEIAKIQDKSLQPVGTGQVKESTAFKKFKDNLPQEERVKRFQSALDKERSNNPEYNTELNYKKLDLAKDAKRAAELINKDPQRALRIAVGVEKPPAGQTETAISIALSDTAGRQGNYELQARLEAARSLRQTRRGQEIVSERGRFDENSPQHFIKELIKARVEKMVADRKELLKGSPEDVKTTAGRAKIIIDRETAQVQKIVRERQSRIQSAQSVIDALTC